MSTAQEVLKSAPAVRRKQAPLLNRALDFASSVRFGVVQLCILVVLSMIGMLIVQQNVQGFDAYYVSLTPAERTVFGYLGFFDIYHSWYFNLLLLSLSLNIVLASIDRFPGVWKGYFRRPKRTATRDWLLNRKFNREFAVNHSSVDEAASAIRSEFENTGLKTAITTDRGATYVFGERGRTNRLGAYIVHVALLTLFLGHFVALQTGFDADVRMTPGVVTDQIEMIRFNLDKKEKFSVKLPFSMECTDIQQRLIDPNGSIDVNNTLDWRTQLRISDPAYGDRVADVSMNNPFQYRGYRFFQAQTIPVGHARTIRLEITPQNGGQPLNVELSRNGSTRLPDGTAVEYGEFLPDFFLGADGRPDTRSGEYNRPVAVLNVTPPNGERTRVYAFSPGVADNIPVGAPKAGYKWRLAEFEKSPLAHVLSIKYDPYNAAFVAWYIGGFGLVGSLAFVFFFSHRRVWARLEQREDGTIDAVLAGDTNRNELRFKDNFDILAKRIAPTKEH